MWWQEHSPSLTSSKSFRACEDTLSTYTFKEEVKMVVPTSDEFKKLSSKQQTEELFNLIQLLLPLTKRVDSITETVSSLSERVSNLESNRSLHKHSSDNHDHSNHDSDSMYKSLTSLGGANANQEPASNIPDPFIIKRSKEINRYIFHFKVLLAYVPTHVELGSLFGNGYVHIPTFFKKVKFDLHTIP